MFTFGCEHELADWYYKDLPQRMARADDWTIVNSNGIAAACNPVKGYPYGGEINTPPSNSISTQLSYLKNLRKLGTSVNYRSNLHVHIRVPGLKDNLKLLKRFQRYIHDCRDILEEMVALPKPNEKGAAHKRAKRNRVSHRTFLSTTRLESQLQAKSVSEFFEKEVPKSKSGTVMWHAQPRVCINLRQLLQTDTIEFRHFPGTLEINELESALVWARDFTITVLEKGSLNNLWKRIKSRPYPQFKPFNEELEVKYQATAYHNGLKQSQIKHNIELIIQGKFSGSKEEQEAKKRAGCLSR